MEIVFSFATGSAFGAFSALSLLAYRAAARQQDRGARNER